MISNDLKGHSGIILHNVESGDATYNGITVDGVSANIADDEESFIIVTPSGGATRVTEGAASGGEGWEYDTYTVRLSRALTSNLAKVYINVVPATAAPEDEAKGYRDLEFYDPANPGTLLPYVNGRQLLPVIAFDNTNWWKPQTVKFRAVQDAASEGTRFAFINHNIDRQITTDPFYVDAKLLSLKVQINDDDRAGVLVTPSGTRNVALEGGFGDSIDVVLTRKPTADVTVTLGTVNGQVTLSSTVLVFSANELAANAWNKAQSVAITAIDDGVKEGFHTDYITYTVTSADEDTYPRNPLLPQDAYKLDGDPDKDVDSDGLPDDIPTTKPTQFMFLAHRPDLTKPVTILYDATGSDDGVQEVALAKYTDQTDAVLRYSIIGNTLEFYQNGLPVAISGSVRASYSYLEPGYNGVRVQDSVVDLYDNEAPAVIITESDGSTDVREQGPSPIRPSPTPTRSCCPRRRPRM